DRQALCQNVVAGTLGDSPAPLRRTGERKVDHIQGRRTAPPSGIDNLDINQRQIGAVRSQTRRTCMNSEPDCGRRSRSLDFTLTDLPAQAVITDSFNHAGLPRDILKSIEKATAPRPEPERFVINKQL